jgi:uncharacterized protein YndB with AHSA1/START domain
MTDTITAQHLRFDRVLDAPVDTVWRYLIDPELRARWFMGGETEPRVGGKFGLAFDHDTLSDGDAPMPEKYAKNVGHSWFETIEAPQKQLVWFEQSAHEVMIEEPGKTLVTLVEHVRPIAERAGDAPPDTQSSPNP